MDEFVIEDGILIEYKATENNVEVIVPEGFVAIGTEAFMYKNVQIVHLPSTLETIEERAFADCDKLLKIEIPHGVTKIGEYAFVSCEMLGSVIFPETLKAISENAFSYCNNLCVVVLPNGLEEIGEDAFTYCENLKVIKIPKTLSNVADRAFSYCSSLKSIVLEDGNESFEVIDGLLIEKATKKAVAYTLAKEGFFKVPDGVEEIGRYAFAGAEFSSIEFCPSLKIIGTDSFYNSKLKKLYIPYHITKICEGAFSAMEQLESVEVDGKNPVYYTDGTMIFLKEDDSLLSCPVTLKGVLRLPAVTRLANGCFGSQEKIERVVFHSEVRHIGDSAFIGCKALKEINFNDRIQTIGEYAFCGCESLETVILPKNITKLEEGVFSDCEGLVNLELNDGLKEIDKYAISSCKSLKKLTVPKSVEKIIDNAFAFSNIEHLELPGNISVDYSRTFDYMDFLKELTLTQKVSEAARGLINAMNNLEKLTLDNSVVDVAPLALNQCSRRTKIYVNKANSKKWDKKWKKDCKGKIIFTKG